MSLRDHFVLLASYNEWMNAKLYASAAELGEFVALGMERKDA
jgi:hypothetical protein